MSEKKFANLQYPGIKADPNEGKKGLPAPVAWRFSAQVECLGEEAQVKLLASSVLVCGASPLGARLTRKLLAAGVGRVGLLGERELTGAYDRPLPQEVGHSKPGVLAELSAWTNRETPWAKFEPFSEVRIDRQLDDIAKGFSLLVAADTEGLSDAMNAARMLNAPVLAGGSSGKSAWAVAIPSGALCLDCLRHQLPRYPADGAGFYYPLLDWAAVRLSAMVFDQILPLGVSTAFMELCDASANPWKMEQRPLSPKPGCSTCAS